MTGAFIDVVFFILPLTSCANQSCHNEGTAISALLFTALERYRWKIKHKHQQNCSIKHSTPTFLSTATQRNQWQVFLVREHRLNIKVIRDHVRMGSRLLYKSWCWTRSQVSNAVLEVIISVKASQTKQVNNTFSFFIRNFSMLSTLTLQCRSHQSLDKQDLTVLEAKTNLYTDVSISTGSSPSLVFSVSAKTTSSKSNTSIQSNQQATHESYADIPSVMSPVTMTTQSVTLKLETCSVGSKSGLLRRLSAMSITRLDVASDRFLADSTANTFVSISHSGWSGFCLASKGKYLRERL